MSWHHSPYRLMAEARLIYSLEKMGPSPVPSEGGNTPNPEPQPQGPVIEQPPTAEGQINTVKESRDQGLTPLDKESQAIAKENIQIRADNLQFFNESKDQLQSRLQSWLEFSVKTLVETTTDQITSLQHRLHRNIDRQIEIVAVLSRSIDRLDEKFIAYIDKKAQLDPTVDPTGAERRELTRLINNMRQEKNEKVRQNGREGNYVMETLDRADLALDKKRNESTLSFDDPKFSAALDKDVLYKQFDDGFRSQGMAEKLVEGLKGSNIALKLAMEEASDLYRQMQPEQKDVFVSWINKKLSGSGLNQVAKFSGNSLQLAA